jgi:cellulose synthase/poly-beta-1,6-N-acetylglucosamine synthase-like glycosyltransferase
MYGDRLPGRNAIQRSSRRGSYSGPDVTVHTRKAVSVSLLVPMYNEEESADLFLDTVQPLLSEITDDYEIICVSDGSTDSTVERLLERRAMDGRIKISNSREISEKRRPFQQQSMSAQRTWLSRSMSTCRIRRS